MRSLRARKACSGERSRYRLNMRKGRTSWSPLLWYEVITRLVAGSRAGFGEIRRNRIHRVESRTRNEVEQGSPLFVSRNTRSSSTPACPEPTCCTNCIIFSALHDTSVNESYLIILHRVLKCQQYHPSTFFLRQFFRHLSKCL